MWPVARREQGGRLLLLGGRAVLGDEVRVIGVPVGRIDSIEPRAKDVKITMSIDDGVKIPADAQALIISPNLVAARFVQLAPAYTGGPVMADGAEIGLDRTAVPVEWDEVKEQLTQLSSQLGPQQNSVQGPLQAFVDQAADTLDGNGGLFALGDSRAVPDRGSAR